MIYLALAIIHFCIAAIIAGHVLLNKSDVRSAIGWIGLVWLSPFFGAAIYWAFGINRVARRASRMDRDFGTPTGLAKTARVDDSKLDQSRRVLCRVGTELTALPLTGGNRIEILHGGTEAYPEMLAAIAAAGSSIALTTYIFRPDRIGEAFIDALAAARSRGVEVRVLIDGIGSGYFRSPVVGALQKADVAVGRFMHDRRPWKMSFLNLRNHKKLLIVDGQKGFTGGLNLGIENTWTGRERPVVEDTHFVVTGPVVAQMMKSFAEDWHFITLETLDGAIWWPTIDADGPVVARGINSGPDEDVGTIEAILATAVEQARHRVRIVTPYFLPDGKLQAAIDLAILRGVKIELLLPRRSDHVGMEQAMRAHLAFFPLDRLYCFTTPAPFDHSKLVSVDGQWCALGSANWDVRSLRLNFEFMLECYEGNIIADIDALIDEKIETSRRLTSAELNDRPLTVKLRDAGARLFLPYL